MKNIIQFLFSVFFAIAIGVHIYNIYENDHQPLWWHGIYFITYGVCWLMIFSKNKNSSLIYGLMALFPFFTHVYYAYQHAAKLDSEFWICISVCVILPFGFFYLENKKTNN